MSLIGIDFAAEAVLCAEGGARRTSWRFFDTDGAFDGSSMPPKVAAFIRDTTAALQTTRARAGKMLRSGVLGEYQDMLDIVASLEARRAQIVEPFLSTLKHDRARQQELAECAQLSTAQREERVLALARGNKGAVGRVQGV